MVGFTPAVRAYHSTEAAILVPLAEVEPPYRTPTCEKDWRGFERVRFVSVLKGIITGAEIEPIPVRELPEEDFPYVRPYRFRVRDGYHRFYASIVAGFAALPVKL